MYYTLIEKVEGTYPTTVNKYQEYKPYLQKESKGFCVYCGINESLIGGVDSFHVEHFKPKSVDRFASLELDYSNLFYSCAVCNRFKSNDWPNDHLSDHSISSYINPSIYNYMDIFNLADNGILYSKYVSGKYMIEKIYLNRDQLILARRLLMCLKRYDKLKKDIKIVNMEMRKAKNKSLASKYATDLIEKVVTLTDSFAEEIRKPKYSMSDVKRK